jgi:penicillin-binding protein 2
VTYPSYNLETYSADYAENASNPLYPFLNRAFSGIYAPGSCFKPSVATAGLSEGVITPESTVFCGHVYTFYPSYQPTCLGYHGLMTVTDALRASCNIFFYDTGRQLGIDRMNEYARSLGLGVPTGIELSEAQGTQCDPDSINPGDASRQP